MNDDDEWQCHIVYGSDVAQDLDNLLEVDDLSVVLSSKHRPRCIIEFISQSLQLLDIEATNRHLLVKVHFPLISEARFNVKLV